MPRQSYYVPPEEQHTLPQLSDGWVGLRPFGVVEPRRPNRFVYFIKGQYAGDFREHRTFHTREEAETAWKNRVAELNLYRAWYRIEGAEVTMVHRLYREPEQYARFDNNAEQIDIIKKHWSPQLFQNGRYYLMRAADVGHTTVFAHHEVARSYGYDWAIIDHINRNSLDNRIENLRDGSGTVNSRNQAMPHNNKSGVCGVSFNRYKDQWVAQWRENGKQRVKTFAVKKYGGPTAKHMATEYRKEMCLRLGNTNGSTPSMRRSCKRKADDIDD